MTPSDSNFEDLAQVEQITRINESNAEVVIDWRKQLAEHYGDDRRLLGQDHAGRIAGR